MKKYFLLGILMALVPNICLGADSRFTQLVREKERKMAELEKCMGSTKGLKIAGISTLGLTAVGVAGNVIEAKKIKDYDKTIESTQKSIAKTEADIETKNAELAKLQAKNEKTTPTLTPTPASTPVNEEQSQCIDRIEQEFANGVPEKYKDSFNEAREQIDDILEKIADEDGGMIWYGYKFTCKKGQKLKDCGADKFLQNVHNSVLKAVVTDKECGTQLFNGVEEPKLLSGADVATDIYSENCKKSRGMLMSPGMCRCLYGGTADFMGNCPSAPNLTDDKKITPTTKHDDKLLAAQCKAQGGKWDPTRHNDEDDTLPGVCVLPEAVVSTTAPDWAKPVSNPEKMLQNVVTQDIATINGTPGNLGDKIYIHGYTISNIQHLPIHDTLYNAIQEFNKRCYDNAGDPDDAYSVVIGIDDDALGDDDDEKYTENTVLPNSRQYLVSRCECNDYDWKKQGSKCVKK